MGKKGVSTLSTLSTPVFSKKHRNFLGFYPSISDDTVDSVDILRGLLFGSIDSNDSIFIDTPPYTACQIDAQIKYTKNAPEGGLACAKLYTICSPNTPRAIARKVQTMGKPVGTFNTCLHKKRQSIIKVMHI
jgi:hypothetical protein